VSDMIADAAVSAPSSLYKYVSFQGLRRILAGSVRFTQPSAFNDPFELLPEIAMPIGEPERKIKLNFDILGKRRNPPVGDIDILPGGYGSGDWSSRDIVQLLNKLIGFFCLSKNSQSLLMWSHYADQYAGAIVEFDTSHEFFAHPIEIEYRACRPRKHLSMYLTDEPIPVSELCVKSKEWEYEGEVRIIRFLADCEEVSCRDKRGFPIFTQTLPVEAIKSVTLGERMSIPKQREILGRIMNTNIALYQAAIDLSGYSLSRVVIKLPVPLSEMNPPVLTPRTANIFRELPGPFGELARKLREHPLSKIVNKPV
jgi:hypothetical protein